MKRHLLRLSPPLLFCFFAAARPGQGQVVANSEWNTGGGNWNVAANWAPADVPDNGGFTVYNVLIGNRPAAANAGVTFIPEDGTSDTVSSFTLSNGADFTTNGSQLIVAGPCTINGTVPITAFVVDAHDTAGTTAFQANLVHVNNGGFLVMNGGIAEVPGRLELNSSSLNGFGTLNLGDADGLTEMVFENSGTLGPTGSGVTPGLLTLHANGTDTLDLDGVSETGVVDVSNALTDPEGDVLTLIVDGPLTDTFGGTAGAAILIGQRDTLRFTQNFTLSAGAAITMDGGNSVATLGGPAAITSIAGTSFNITGDAVIDNALTFTGSANTITVAGGRSLTLNGAVTLPDASALSMALNSELILGGSLAVTEPAGDFNWDGAGSARTTLKGNAVLSLDVNRVDTGDNTFGGILTLDDSAVVSVNVAAASWTLAGTMTKEGTGTSTVTGDDLLVAGFVDVNSGTLNLPETTVLNAADVTVNGGTLNFARAALQSGSHVTVNGLLSLGQGSTLSGPTTLTGTGTLRMASSSTVAANTTVAVRTLDWDGTVNGSVQTIADGVVFTINSPTFDTDGAMDDPISLGGNGAQLIVSGPLQWTMNGTLTANAAAAGTAVIGGTSDLVLAGTTNVDGNTNVSAPLTFGAGSTTSIDAAMTLHVIGTTANYKGGAITGAGTYDPGGVNTVTADTSITTTSFDFDGGIWTVQNDAVLTINVTDYEPDNATNSFEGTIFVQDSDISVNTADTRFVMNGTLNMSAAPGSPAAWIGEPLDIGNGTGNRDAHVNITGTSQSEVAPGVNFYSDADVDIAAGATLVMLGTVNFETVNGVNSAEFTGAGRFVFSNDVNVNEAVTLNMPGGIVDLDGLDGVGDFINIDAPFTINVQTMTPFGKSNAGGGVNTLDINNSAGTGMLTVNLDDAAAEWNLNGSGVMNLTNDNTLATLLAGSTVNLYGAVNVAGAAGISARARLHGTTIIAPNGRLVLQKAGLPATLSNTLEGGTINGTGTIAAEATCSLRGFGSINAPVDFSPSAAQLVAEGGLLDVNAMIVSMGVLRVDTAPAVLDLAVPVSTSVITGGIILSGGTLQGAAVTTTSTTRAIFGRGTVASQVINLGALRASGGTLVFTDASSDWDGTANNGSLRADAGATLELVDNATFPFTGSVVALEGGRVFVNGFSLDFNAGSSIQLTAGTYESLHNTDLGGTVTVNAGAASTIKVRDSFRLQFEAPAVTSLNGNLVLDNDSIRVFAGAAFSGTGALIVAPGSGLVTDPNVNINVLLDNRGSFQAGGSNTVGRADVRDYQQTATGELFIEITGPGLNEFDRVVVNGAAQLHGVLILDIDGGFVPTAGQSFDVLTATGGVSGKFDSVIYSGLLDGLGFDVTYLPNTVRVTVAPQSAYDQWIEDRVIEAQSPGISVGNLDWGKGSDFDRDGLTNIGEFALNGHPFIGSRPAKIFPKIATVGAASVFTLTVPVRNGAVADAADPAGGELVLKQTADVLTYRIQAGDVLTNDWTLDVGEVIGVSATAIQSGLPPPDPGWQYRTFRSQGAVTNDPREYMRVVITE